VEQEIAAIAQLLTDHPTLERVLLNPAVPTPRKRAAVAEISQRARLLPLVGKLLVMLTDRDRLALLPGVLASYRLRLMEHNKVVRADVTTASPLSPDRANAIKGSLERVTGRTVTLSTRVDPAVIAGLVARIGDTIYDGSVATQLGKMKRRLMEKA
jgi:F-type H+-transporting ATPase subunit delta